MNISVNFSHSSCSTNIIFVKLESMKKVKVRSVGENSSDSDCSSKVDASRKTAKIGGR